MNPLSVLLCRRADLANSQVFPVLGCHRLVGVVHCHRGVSEALEAGVGKDLIGRTIDPHDRHRWLAYLIA